METVTLQGSCLCGAVKYQVSGTVERFYHCHCLRCRKASGTGHATNVMVSGARLVFETGETMLKQFKLPEARRFTRQFCSNCGASVARFVPEINAVVVPAGSLDGKIPIKPQARVFWGSRADWSCDGDSLPRFSEYPG